MVHHESILETWRVSLFDHHTHSYPHYLILLADNTYLCTCLYIISHGFYCRHFFSVFKMSCNAKFDIKLIPKRWHADLFREFDSLSIMGTTIEQDTIEETNQVISIRGPDVVQPSIYKDITQKQEYAHGFGIAKSGLKFAVEMV
ncbi:hypothetical protein C2G38_403024 [Gigaspora rosea]|uniref:SWIM-type domain-containing protein n=1 Tax=Gigaspora rosea TaxID=44941 RepID=A0A397VVQ5_9GLOM|nr:hypothetical protein C2G38_403024 [Gigaspora rosea]